MVDYLQIVSELSGLARMEGAWSKISLKTCGLVELLFLLRYSTESWCLSLVIMENSPLAKWFQEMYFLLSKFKAFISE